MDEWFWLGAACVVVLIWLVGMVKSWRLPGSTPDKPAGQAKGKHLLRPRTPDDCGLCRAEAAPTVGDEAGAPCGRVGRPWAEVKSRRGDASGRRRRGIPARIKGMSTTGSRIHRFTPFQGVTSITDFFICSPARRAAQCSPGAKRLVPDT